MKNLLTSETTYALIRQIGVALGHSLWIGAAAALLAAAVVVCTRRRRPEIRYNLLTGLLLLFVTATAVAFVQSGSDVSVETQVRNASAILLANGAAGSSPSISRPQSLIGIATDFLVQNIYAITWLWLVVVIAKISGLALGLYRLHQLKTQQIYSIGSYWEQRVGEFARTLGIAQHVKIFNPAW